MHGIGRSLTCVHCHRHTEFISSVNTITIVCLNYALTTLLEIDLQGVGGVGGGQAQPAASLGQTIVSSMYTNGIAYLNTCQRMVYYGVNYN